MLLVASLYRNWDKLWPDEPFDLLGNFAWYVNRFWEYWLPPFRDRFTWVRMCNWPVHPTRLWTKSGAGREVRVTHEFFLKLVTRSVRVSRSLCATRSLCESRALYARLCNDSIFARVSLFCAWLALYSSLALTSAPSKRQFFSSGACASCSKFEWDEDSKNLSSEVPFSIFAKPSCYLLLAQMKQSF